MSVWGIDWATEKHDVIVEDEASVEVLAETFAHDEHGLTALCRALVRLEVSLVAVERPDGLLVERLLDAGLRVLPPSPPTTFERACTVDSTPATLGLSSAIDRPASCSRGHA